jgi:diguanylate cyclase (GGDEF)-like protein/PAS domain S-box-containing protein
MGAVDHEDPAGNDAVAAPRDLEAEAELLRRARRFVGQGVLPRAGGATAVREAERLEVVDRLDGGSVEGRLGSGLVSRTNSRSASGTSTTNGTGTINPTSETSSTSGSDTSEEIDQVERLGTIDEVGEDDLATPHQPPSTRSIPNGLLPRSLLIVDDARPDEDVEAGRVLLEALDRSDDPVAVFRWPSGRAIWMNAAFEARTPFDDEPDRLSDRTPLRMIDEWSQAHFLVRAMPVLMERGTWRGRLALLDHDGHPEIMDVSLVVHRDTFGEIDTMTMVGHAPLPHKAAPVAGPDADEEEAATQLLDALMQHVTDLVLIVDVQGTIAFASPAATDLLGAGVGTGDGAEPGLLELVHPDDRPADLFELLLRQDDGEVRATGLRLRDAAGDWRYVEAMVTDLRDNPAIGGFVVNARDVTGEIEARAEVTSSVYTDDLTGLPNRLRLLDRAESVLQGDGEDRDLTFLLVDIDRFRAVNDAYGRKVTDAVLVEIAQRLVEAVGDEGMVARLRSDEFAVLLPDMGRTAPAVSLAARLREAVGKPIARHGATVEVSVSIGAVVHTVGDSRDDLLGDADRALQRAKRAGGNRTELHDGAAARHERRRLSIDRHLRRTLDRDGVELHYQPIFRLQDTSMVAVEALLRVRGDRGELLSPGAVVESAESTGLIYRLGRSVLFTACRQIAEARELGDHASSLELSVNISPRQLADPQFALAVGEVLEETGLEPSALWLEISERTLADRIEVSSVGMRALRERGVRLGVDEFGNGSTSLGWLRRFPVDFVKIDRSLVAGLGVNQVDGAIVRSSTELAQALGLTVIAVGVENEDQLDQLVQMGCDRAQGFLFSSAMPAESVASLANIWT